MEKKIKTIIISIPDVQNQITKTINSQEVGSNNGHSCTRKVSLSCFNVGCFSIWQSN